MLVVLTMLDEAANPGVFNRKLEQACTENGLPVVKYNLEPETARNFQKTMAGAMTGAAPKVPTFGASTSTPTTTTKYYRDNIKSSTRRTKTPREQDDFEGTMTGSKKSKVTEPRTPRQETEIEGIVPIEPTKETNNTENELIDMSAIEGDTLDNSMNQPSTIQARLIKDTLGRISGELKSKYILMESDNAIPNQKVYLQKQPIKDLIKNLIINPKNRNKRVWINYVEKDLRQLVQWGLGNREIYYTGLQHTTVELCLHKTHQSTIIQCNYAFI